MSKYFLTKHTFFCVIDGHFVFLDLHNDKYMCLPLGQTTALQSLLYNRDTAAENTEPQDIIDDKNILEIINELLTKGLLTKDPKKGKKAIPVAMPPPSTDLVGYELGKSPKIRFSHVAKFLKASYFSATRLHWKSVENVARMVKQRKLHRQATAEKPNTEEVRELVEIFKILRPLFFTAKNHCLFDSLALLEFLSYYGIFPSWVFGIKMRPFSAHCWVREGDVIFNDSVDHVTFFAPIMAI